jgi:drug/metabolite transporter (DMT)-like permease
VDGEPKHGTGVFHSEAEKAAVLSSRMLQGLPLFSGPAGPGSIQPRYCGIRSAEMQPPSSQKRRISYKLGSIYAVVTALLLSVQEPFSFLAAKRLSVTQFVFLTQVALLMSIPILMVRERSRRDLILLLGNAATYGKLGVLLLVGMLGLLLFKLALSNAHPIIISAIINLQPFFAALVALLIARVPIPVSPTIFFGCLHQRVSGRDGGRVEPGRRGQPARLKPVG